MVKTITITDEAYERVKAMKMPGESFSVLFKRKFNHKLKIKEIPAYLEELKMDENRANEWIKTVHKNREKIGKDMELRQNVFTR